jgi:hypothetical protein
MKKIIQWIGGICEVLNGWPILLPLFGPLVWIYWLVIEKHYLLLSIVSFLWLSSVAFIIHQILHNKNLTISIGIFLVWMVVLAFVFAERSFLF